MFVGHVFYDSENIEEFMFISNLNLKKSSLLKIRKSYSTILKFLLKLFCMVFIVPCDKRMFLDNVRQTMKKNVQWKKKNVVKKTVYYL